jgi:hypothetical protein
MFYSEFLYTAIYTSCVFFYAKYIFSIHTLILSTIEIKEPFNPDSKNPHLDSPDHALDDHFEASAEGAVDKKVYRGIHHQQQVAEAENSKIF